MSGTVNISRHLFDSKAFRDEPLTEREAWVWLVIAASWKDRTVRAGDYVADTKRGQLAHSIRYMARAWGWTPAKAQRYLNRVKKLKMIRVETDTGVSIITICNYDKYQGEGKASDTPPIHLRYTSDTDKKKDERRGKEDTNVSLQKTPARRRSRIPEDATISDAQTRAGKKRGHSQQEIEAQFQKFKNDALAKGKTFVDWDRAFVTWLDSEYFRPITPQLTQVTGGQNGQSASKSASRMGAFIGGARGA